MTLNLTTEVRRILPRVYLVTATRIFAGGNGRPTWSKTYFGGIVFGDRPNIVQQAEITTRIIVRITRK